MRWKGLLGSLLCLALVACSTAFTAPSPVLATAEGKLSRSFKCAAPVHDHTTAGRVGGGRAALGGGRTAFSTLHMAAASAEAEVDMQGKVCLVTGGNRGMGLMTARGLLSKGAHVIVTCRDAEGEERAARKLKAFKLVKAGSSEAGTAALVRCDFSSLSDVRRCAAELSAAYPSVDRVVANAGVMATPYSKTDDGFESQFQVNFLSQFLLVQLLQNSLKTSSRVILISSLSSEMASLGNQTLPSVATQEEATYDKMTAYRRSKLAQVMMARELPKRMPGVEAYSVHPGIVATDLFFRGMPAWKKLLLKGLSKTLAMFGAVKSAKKGAATALFLCTAPDAKGDGRYWAESSEREGNPEALDAALCAKVWDESEKLLGSI